jgi:hypothetical protein
MTIPHTLRVLSESYAFEPDAYVARFRAGAGAEELIRIG